MGLTVEQLTQMIASLPGNEDTEAASSFLKQSDLTKIIPTGDNVISSSAEEYLRIYEIRQEHAMKAGMVTRGFPSLLAALRKLRPLELLTVTAFATAEWYGTFWSNRADRLVGFVLVERRSPQQEQERLEWFRQNLT